MGVPTVKLDPSGNLLMKKHTRKYWKQICPYNRESSNKFCNMSCPLFFLDIDKKTLQLCKVKYENINFD
jgi:hypothetical protein